MSITTPNITEPDITSEVSRSYILSNLRQRVIDEAGLYTFWDFSDASSITDPGTGATQVTDQMGNENLIQDGATSTTPEVGDGVLNFGGSDFMYVNNSTPSFKFLHNGLGGTVIWAGKIGNIANPDDIFTLFATNDSVTTSQGAWVTYDDRAIASRNNAVLYRVGNGISSVINGVGLDDLTPNTDVIIEYVFASGSGFIREDGTLVDNTAQTNSPDNDSAQHNFVLGANGDASAYFLEGYMRCCMTKSGVLSSDQRALIIEYIQGLY